MKKLKYLLSLSVIAAMAACTSPVRKAAEYPMFWTWLDYRPAMFDCMDAALNNRTGGKLQKTGLHHFPVYEPAKGFYGKE